MSAAVAVTSSVTAVANRLNCIMNDKLRRLRLSLQKRIVANDVAMDRMSSVIPAGLLDVPALPPHVLPP